MQMRRCDTGAAHHPFVRLANRFLLFGSLARHPHPYLSPSSCLGGSHLAVMPKVDAKTEKKVKAAAPEKKKRAKKEKDPNKPKRALSAYMFFVQDYRERIKNENPDVTFGEVGKLLGAKWKEMKDSEKKPYDDAAEKDKVRAAKDKSAYEAGGGGGGGGATTKKPSSSKKVTKAEVEEEDDDDEDDE
ncbi:MAG: Non-histone chromosomal protein 6 [Tremellales sp. Tagirdzhanova-0007]|nr:MAG: Non-histone chromosomal protein 6 [Tremellales sp. Tagirdzhanova-0007]